MTFHIPGVGILFRVVGNSYQWTKKRMFGKTLQASHRAWLKRTGLGSHWFALGEGIECSLKLAKWPEGPTQSHIALRNTSKELAAVTVVVEAHSGETVFDETRVVSNICNSPRVVALPSIPIYEIYIDAGGHGIRSTYNDFQVRITSITEGSAARTVNLTSPRFHPIDNVLAEPDHWIKWEGEALNVGTIRAQQEELKTRWWRKLGHPQLSVGQSLSGLNYPRYVIATVLLSDPVVRTTYWTLLITGWEKFIKDNEGKPT